MNNLITLAKINKTYGKDGAKTPVLRDISLKINQGELVAIIGASGSGKTTLMNMIGLLDKPDTGSYLFESVNVYKLKDAELARLRRKSIGFIFQNFNLLGRMSARSNVELPMIYAGLSRSTRKKRAESLLKQIGLGERLTHRPNQLSGGQMQRVAVARALANKPRLILADEPTGNLDSKTGAEVIKLLKDLHAEGNTIIVVTHDTAIAKKADRIIHIKDGRIIK
jgi:putative bacteriocin export ABC transporter (lactococcin 972 group)